MHPSDLSHPGIDLSVGGAHAVQWLAGEVDIAYADRIVEIGLRAVAAPDVDELVVDLSRVTFLDSTGLGALVDLRNRSLAARKRFALRGVPPSVARILSITGLERTFGVHAGADAGRC